MNRRFVVAATAAALAAGVLAATAGSAGAAPPPPFTVKTDPNFGAASAAGAVGIYATGSILNVQPTGTVACVSPQPRTVSDVAEVPLSPLADVLALHAECNIAPRSDIAEAKSKIASVDLLNGAIDLVGVTAKCSITATGAATCGTQLAYLNGRSVGVGPIHIVIPGVAAVYVNKITEDAFGMNAIAVQVVVAPIVVAGHIIKDGETIDIGVASIAKQCDCG
jgi:hypothetical protein